MKATDPVAFFMCVQYVKWLNCRRITWSNIHLGDIGEAILGPANQETQLKESGIPMVALAIIPQPGSNYVAIADEFYKRYDQLKASVHPLPAHRKIM